MTDGGDGASGRIYKHSMESINSIKNALNRPEVKVKMRRKKPPRSKKHREAMCVSMKNSDNHKSAMEKRKDNINWIESIEKNANNKKRIEAVVKAIKSDEYRKNHSKKMIEWWKKRKEQQINNTI